MYSTLRKKIERKLGSKFLAIGNKLLRREKMIKFLNQVDEYEKLNHNNRFHIKKSEFEPYLDEATSTTPFNAHYIYHPAWAARIVQKINPEKHIDISSSLSFSTMLSANIPTEFYDYRPALLNLDGLTSGSANLLGLPFESYSVESISCMHTIEHVGLGRYGDPMDPDGDLKSIAELKRVVKKAGHLLFVVPVGIPKLSFNAHRIYSYQMISDLFPEFDVRDFSLVTDQEQFVSPATPDLVSQQHYGCGCFWFVKK